MAVAPIHQVRKVMDYTVSVIPSEKLRIGIPNYGYDWPLPFEKGTTKAKTIGNVEAVQIAIENGAGYWQIMQLFRANWLLFSDFAEIVK